MTQNQFIWWPKVNESLNKSPEKFSNEENLKNLNWEDIKLDWGWLYNTWKSVEEEKIDIDSKNEIEENPNNLQNTSKIIDKETINEDINKKIDENPNTPLINLFIKKWLLSNKEWNLIKESFVKNGDIIDNLSKIEWLDLDKIHQITSSISFLEKWETKSYNIKKFNDKFEWEISEFKEPNKIWKKGTLELFWQNKRLIENLWWNYFEIWNEKISDDLNKDLLNTSFKKTLNELMKWKKFKRPDTFDKMVWYINNDKFSFKDRFSYLKKIDILINDDQSRSNEKQSISSKNSQDFVNEKNLNLEERFNNFKEELKIIDEKITLNNKERLEKLYELSLLLIEDYRESWDIFKASEIDILWSEIQEVLKEQS